MSNQFFLQDGGTPFRGAAASGGGSKSEDRGSSSPDDPWSSIRLGDKEKDRELQRAFETILQQKEDRAKVLAALQGSLGKEGEAAAAAK